MSAPDLEAERRAVEAAIRTAFKGVDRAGGVSWSESVVIDNYGSEDEREAARACDTEKNWESLVDDHSWIEEPGVGGFNFLDPIGFRYYMAPAMIRCTRRGYGEFIGYALDIDYDFKRNLVSEFSPAQLAATARFVRFMINVHAAEGDAIYVRQWKQDYKAYWRQFDRDSTQ